MNERIPPQAIEIEEAVLGAMMIEREAADIVMSMLSEKDFYKPAHQTIYRALSKLNSENSPMDLITLEALLRDQGDLDKTGGTSYLADLTRSVSSSANADYHCQLIKEKSMRRGIIQECNKIIQSAYDTTIDTYDVIDKAQEAMFSVDDTSKGGLKGIADIVTRVAKKVEKIQESGRPIGLRTGLDIDKTLQGFQDGKLYIIGARPSMGKTALVMTIMRRLALDNQKTGILSLETSDESLGIRLISQVSEIPAEKITSGSMSFEQMKKFSNACQDLANLGIYIDDEAALTIQKVRSKCRLLVKQGVKIIFIDFLQLLSEEGRSKHEEIGKITKGLKQISKELNIPVVALSQLSRKVEERSIKRPQMSDLRESGSIEEDADVIIFLYRPEYYGVTETSDHRSTEGLAEVIIAKNKDGKTGMKELRFIKEYMRFENIEFYHPEPIQPPHVPMIDDEQPF